MQPVLKDRGGVPAVRFAEKPLVFGPRPFVFHRPKLLFLKSKPSVAKTNRFCPQAGVKSVQRTRGHPKGRRRKGKRRCRRGKNVADEESDVADGQRAVADGERGFDKRSGAVIGRPIKAHAPHAETRGVHAVIIPQKRGKEIPISAPPIALSATGKSPDAREGGNGCLMMSNAARWRALQNRARPRAA